MIGIAALHMRKIGSLDPPLVVTTIMSNLGLEETLGRHGIGMIRTPVGDRNVAQAMVERGAKLGGEQSGHIIFSDHSPTGDGILTVVKLLEIAHESGSDITSLAATIELIVRPSGTQPILRIMVEGEDERTCAEVCSLIEEGIRRLLL